MRKPFTFGLVAGITVSAVTFTVEVIVFLIYIIRIKAMLSGWRMN